MSLVMFIGAVIVVVLCVAFYFDVKRRNSRRLPDDLHTSRQLNKPREGSEFRHLPPGAPSGDA